MMRKQACVMVLGASLLLGAGALAESKDAKKAPAQKAPSAEQQAMMEAWQKAATPGAPHARLKAMAGTFDAVTRMWMQPGAAPQESKGKSENKLIFDGRFLHQEFKGTMMGQPFTGIGYTGYDNTRKKYVGSWMDSMGTSLTYSDGTADPAGKVLTMGMKVADPVTGKETTNRTVTRIESDAKHVFEMYETAPDGKEFKSMEIVYTRSK
jgi:hypothetical protein